MHVHPSRRKAYSTYSSFNTLTHLFNVVKRSCFRILQSTRETEKGRRVHSVLCAKHCRIIFRRCCHPHLNNKADRPPRPSVLGIGESWSRAWTTKAIGETCHHTSINDPLLLPNHCAARQSNRSLSRKLPQ